jgi:aryl-alcohol dehydrogenase-like predicted oxidoreductase
MEAWGPGNRQERTWRILSVVEEIEDQGLKRTQAWLAWLNARPAATAVILCARTTDQLADNLAAASVELTLKTSSA